MSENNEKSQKKNTGMLVPILAIITIGCVIFSALQTVYIIRLASGEVGNMSYAQGTQSREEGEGSNEETQMTVSPVADPEFSLEHAASVTDPNKTTLSTTEIVQQVSPAVVSVYVMEHVGDTTSPLFTGSGFIVSSEG